MSKVKLEFTPPTSLSDITLEQYQKYLKIVETNKEDENATDFLNLKSLEIFCGLELKEAYKIPISTFNFALEHIKACFSEETPLQKYFSFIDTEGVKQEMGFMPKLEDMSYGEYVDLDKYFSDWQEMHKAMAVLFRPIETRYKESYLLREYNGTDMYGEAMKRMPMDIVFGAVVFFYRLGMKLSENMIPYLEKKAQKSSKFKETLLENGDGIQASMRSLRATLEDSMRYQRFHYTKQ